MFVAVVRTVRPLGRQLVLDLELERERIPGLCMEDVPEHDAVWLVLTRVPGDPAHEAVDGIRVFRLGQRKLVSASVELVRPVLRAGSATGSAPGPCPPVAISSTP